MLIEIKKNIITEALKKKGQKQNAPLDLLFQMAICAKKGYHVILVPSLVDDRKLQEKLSELITEANVNVLCYAEDRHKQDIGWLINNASVRMVVSYEKESVEKGKIVFNPLREADFQPYTELFLLVENLLDADFYQIVLKAYRKNKGINGYECSFYPLMGGGVTSGQVMSNEVRLRKHLCLAIADSDKHCPTIRKGDTCGKLLDALAPDYPFCSVCWMENVLEIENLIPIHVVRLLYPLKSGEIDIFAKDSSFFDMKFGLNLKDLVEDKVNDYWANLLPEKSDAFALRAQLKESNKKKTKAEFQKVLNDIPILSGFGIHLLERVLNADMNAIKTIRDENIHANDLLHKTTFNDLTASQRIEWERIGEAIFSWACGMKAS